MPDSLKAPAFAPLTTERFTLRALRLGDAAAVHRLVNDWDVAKNLARVPFPYPSTLAEEWIASTHDQMAAGDAWHLAITGEENGAEVLVGCVGLTRSQKDDSAELGYWIGRRYWGHGVAPEAAGKLARWALANLDLGLITASALTDNVRSQAVLRRIGFRDAGQGSQDFVSRGGAMPVALFALRREDLPVGSAPEPPPQAEEPANKKIVLVAAVALVDSDGRVLLARRPEGKALAGLWEFPGGKVHPGETPEDALIRELKEELAIDVSAACLGPFTFASHAYEKFHLLMPLYLCRRWNGTPTPVEGQTLAWVRPTKLASYPMPPADKPLVALLRDFL